MKKKAHTFKALIFLLSFSTQANSAIDFTNSYNALLLQNIEDVLINDIIDKRLWYRTIERLKNQIISQRQPITPLALTCECLFTSLREMNKIEALIKDIKLSHRKIIEETLEKITSGSPKELEKIHSLVTAPLTKKFLSREFHLSPINSPQRYVNRGKFRHSFAEIRLSRRLIAAYDTSDFSAYEMNLLSYFMNQPVWKVVKLFFAFY